MSSGDNYHYNKSTQPLANELRHNMTEAEIFLWTNALRNSMMNGYPFRRQRPVLGWIADFMYLELQLIIEVDGSIHRQEGVTVRDLEKETGLTAAGYTVMRFTNHEVLYHMAEVKRKIEFWIEDYEQANGLVSKEARVRKSRRTF